MQKPHVSIYGPFKALDSDGNQVDLVSTKARHVLTALILAYPEPVQRDSICRLMWPESSDESRKTRLRQELGILREFASRIQREDLLVVDKGILALNADGILVDCWESRKLYSAYASTLPLDDRLQNLTQQIQLLGRGQIAPDTQTLFEAERKRKCSRLTTARIELTKLYIDAGRLPEARQVLDAVLDLHPDNDIAKALNARVLEAPSTMRVNQAITDAPETTEARKTFLEWMKAASWKVRLAIATVTLAVLITFFFPSKAALVPPTPTTLVKTPPISNIIAYQYVPGPGELDDSEFIAADRKEDGSVALAGIVKTKTEDVDGIVALLGPDLKPRWTKRFTGPSHDADRLESVRSDEANNVFAAGETYSVGQPNVKEGWYGQVVAYDQSGKQLFQSRTRKTIIHGSEVKRRIVPDERGGAWYCSSSAAGGKEQIFATHFDRTGRVINDIVIGGVNAKVVAFGRHTQDEYCVLANAKSSSTSGAGDWFMTSFTNDGRIKWTTKLDGPAKGDDTITTEILSKQAEYHFVGGTMSSAKSSGEPPLLQPTIATINVHTGAVGRQFSLKSDLPNPYVSIFDLSRKGEIQLTVKEASIDSRAPVELYILDAVTGAIKQSKKLSLPDGQYLTNVRRFVSNPKTGTLQVISNTARDIGTNASQAIVISTLRTNGELTHEVYKNLDRVTLNIIEQTIGVGQVDMGGRCPATVFSLPYPD